MVGAEAPAARIRTGCTVPRTAAAASLRRNQTIAAARLAMSGVEAWL